MFQTSFREEEKKWANKVGQVYLRLNGRLPHRNILVEFLNNWKLDFEHKKIKIMMVEEYKL